MSTWFRHGDPRFPFLWESAPQASARWHTATDAPASYYADTPDGAWAEFLRHEEITAPEDLDGVSRRLWAVEVPDDVHTGAVEPELDEMVLLGGLATYPDCQAEARRLRAAGARAGPAPHSCPVPPAASSSQPGRRMLTDATDGCWSCSVQHGRRSVAGRRSTPEHRPAGSSTSYAP